MFGVRVLCFSLCWLAVSVCVKSAEESTDLTFWHAPRRYALGRADEAKSGVHGVQDSRDHAISTLVQH
jgi:hypothetical protein